MFHKHIWWIRPSYSTHYRHNKATNINFLVPYLENEHILLILWRPFWILAHARKEISINKQCHHVSRVWIHMFGHLKCVSMVSIKRIIRFLPFSKWPIWPLRAIDGRCVRSNFWSSLDTFRRGNSADPYSTSVDLSFDTIKPLYQVGCNLFPQNGLWVIDYLYFLRYIVVYW